MLELELNNVYNKCLLDNEDYDKISKFHWGVNKDGCVQARIDNKTTCIHRLILNIFSKDLVVDHIDGNPLNNQKSNLRICNKDKNSKNRRLSSRNISGYKGVSKTKDRYKAIIVNNKKHIYLGTFDTKEEAAKAYHKEYAVLNFPDKE